MSSSAGKSDIGSKSTNRMPMLIVGLVVMMILMITNFYLTSNHTSSSAKYVTRATELRVLSQLIAKNALESAAGNDGAFAPLQYAKSEFGKSWTQIQIGTSDDALTADSIFVAQAADQILGVDNVWKRVSANTEVILEGQRTVVNLYDVAKTLSDTVPILQEDYSTVVKTLVKNRAPADQVALAQRQLLLAERIVRSASEVLEGGDGASVATENFRRDTDDFARVLNGMLKGDKTLGISALRDKKSIVALNEVNDSFETVRFSVEEILGNSEELLKVLQAADTIFADSQQLLTETKALTVSFEGTELNYWSIGLGFGFGSAALGFLISIFLSSINQTNRNLSEEERRRETEEEANQANQKAILRLLDELSDLADGDLTVETTVTEDFTGAIADSINFTIDQLRSLVSTINETAVQVSSSAQETQATAVHLAEASEHQAQEIAGASAAVNEMAVTIDQVSANSAESSAVAERSVSIANKGAEVVQNTIHGMDTIREQIQETAKRIKRLGESSQEIGDIVSLINDISDQTNILALNAAIQASMAGEAGRGFAVVADEVQRLAERSSAATKQIEALVKTIQTDTNEAVISMEQTTSEVVSGARLAQDAGVALEEIENVSSNLADLIQNISNAARQQAASAGHISNTMNVIQEITSQTSAGTTATATSIGNLTDMAVQMRNSVAGFKLPESA